MLPTDSSVQSPDRLGHREDMRDNSAEILFWSFLQGGHYEQFWHGQGCPLFGVVHPAFPLPTTLSLTLQGALKDEREEAFMACNMLQTMQVSVSWQLPEEVPVDPQGS